MAITVTPFAVQVSGKLAKIYARQEKASEAINEDGTRKLVAVEYEASTPLLNSDGSRKSDEQIVAELQVALRVKVMASVQLGKRQIAVPPPMVIEGVDELAEPEANPGVLHDLQLRQAVR